MRVRREPARVLRLAGQCKASAESHARLCGRLASYCDLSAARLALRLLVLHHTSQACSFFLPAAAPRFLPRGIPFAAIRFY